MALTILLSLLLATTLQVFAHGSGTECKCEDKINSLTAGNYTWNIKCSDVTLDIMSEAQCMPKSSEMCLDIKYKNNKCVHLCLKKEGNGSICLTCEGKDNCEGSSSSQPMQIFINNNQFINFAQQKICLASSTPKDIKQVLIKFKCVQTVSVCNADDNSTNLNLYQEAKSWIEAMEHCQRGNFSVVEITNQTDNDKLKGLWKYANELKSGLWIGLERSIFGKNPEWKWISGSKVEYNQWNNSYPVNSLNYNCGKIVFINGTNEIKWMNANCHDKLPFICKSLNEIPCHNNVTTLHAEICMDHDEKSTAQFTWDDCKECLNNPTFKGTWRSETLCVGPYPCE